jgi:hypothetical protein
MPQPSDSVAPSSAAVGDSSPTNANAAADPARKSFEERRIAIEERRVALAEQEANRRATAAPQTPKWWKLSLAQVIGVATIAISAAQVWTTYRTTDTQLKLQREQTSATRVQDSIQNRARMIQDSIVAERDWSLRLSTFIADHRAEIFSSDSAKREQMRQILVVSTPPRYLPGLLNRVVIASKSPPVQRDWVRARADAELGRKAALVTASIDIPPISRERMASGNTKYPAAIDVWYAPWSSRRNPNAARVLGRGSLYAYGFVRPGDWAFWVQTLGSSEVESDTARLTFREGFEPSMVFLNRKYMRWPVPTKSDSGGQ